jgi:uncharacterized membrane protein YhhN
MLTTILTLLAILSAALHIRAEYLGPRYHVYLFKPLTMAFILLIALQASWPDFSRYKVAIIVGLLFSLAGDILLMLPSDRFIPGLVSFLAAHLFYIAAFTSGTGFGFSWRALPYVLYDVAIPCILAPHLGQMKLPVVVYMVVILVMAWQPSLVGALQSRQDERLGEANFLKLMIESFKRMPLLRGAESPRSCRKGKRR